MPRRIKVTRRKIALVLLSIFLVILVYTLFFVNERVISKTVTTSTSFSVIKGSSLPPVKAVLITQFTTVGSFSANNQITVAVQIENFNLTNLLDYYCCLAFVSSNGAEAEGVIPLTHSANSTLIGSGNMDFAAPGEIGFFLAPQNSSLHVPVTNNNVITIADTSNTFAWQYGLYTYKLSLIVVASSVIILQPILEAILRVEKNEKIPEKPHPIPDIS